MPNNRNVRIKSNVQRIENTRRNHFVAICDKNLKYVFCLTKETKKKRKLCARSRLLLAINSVPTHAIWSFVVPHFDKYVFSAKRKCNDSKTETKEAAAMLASIHVECHCFKRHPIATNVHINAQSRRKKTWKKRKQCVPKIFRNICFFFESESRLSVVPTTFLCEQMRIATQRCFCYNCFNNNNNLWVCSFIFASKDIAAIRFVPYLIYCGPQFAEMILIWTISHRCVDSRRCLWMILAMLVIVLTFEGNLNKS